MKTKKNKLTISLLCFFLISIGTVSAQLKFGAKANIDVGDHKISTKMLNTKNRMGFSVGPTMEVGIPVIGLELDASLLYGYKKFSVEEKEKQADISNYSYISVPVNLKKRFGLVPRVVGIFVSAGPYANLRLGGGNLKIKDEAKNTYNKFKAKNFEMGINAGLGVNLISKLDVGIYYRCKLTDNYSADKGDIGNLKDKNYQTWSVGATYFF